MILLSGHSLTPDRRVPIEKHSLRLRERESEADITPADMGGIGTESWLLDDVEPGAGIVWRVASIRQEFATATPTVHLEHMINSLRDRIMFGEVDAATMSGRLGATTCTAQEAIEYILSQQSDWVLYSFDFDDVEGPYKFNGDTLYDALSHVSSTLDGAWWSYDFSVYPFRLSITNKASGVGSELIPGRNLSAITKTVDKSGMYTRFYPIGKDDLHITGDYVSKNESTYGVIAKVETDLSLETEDELTAWANERLRKHADPAVTVEVEGLELADATGEGLDRMRLGRICRVPLSEFGVTIQERITELYYADKAHDRESVTITLSNRQDDVARDILHVIAEEIKTGSGRSGAGGRGAAKDQKEDHAWFEDTDEYVAMCAIGIIGVDSEGNPDWYRLSQLVVDGEGVHSMVQRVHYDQVEMYSIITQNEEMLRAEFQDNINSLHSEFQITAESLRSEFTDESNSVRSLITQEANRIGLVVEGYGANAVVKRAAIQAAIVDNNGKLVSTITLDADQVYIGNDTATTVINGKLSTNDLSANIANLNLVEVNRLSTTNDIAAGSLYGQSIYISGATPQSGSFNINQFIRDVQVVDAGNDTYKLQYKTKVDDSWHDATGTFSRATTLTGAWGSGTFEVTASPQGDTFDTTLQIISPTSGSSVSRSGKYVSRPFTVYHGADSDHTSSTGFEQTISIDASSVYNAVKLSASWSGNTLTLDKTIDDASAASFPKNYLITCDTSLAWDSTDNKYKATPKAYCDGVARYTGTQQSTGALSVVVDGYYGYLKEGSTVLQQVQDHHDIGYSQWQKSSDASVMVVQAKCQPDGSTTAPGGTGAEREYQLTYSNGYAHITRGGTNYASLQCGGSSYSHSVTLTYRGWDSANSRYEWTTTTYVSGLTTGGRYTVHW